MSVGDGVAQLLPRSSVADPPVPRPRPSGGGFSLVETPSAARLQPRLPPDLRRVRQAPPARGAARTEAASGPGEDAPTPHEGVGATVAASSPIRLAAQAVGGMGPAARAEKLPIPGVSVGTGRNKLVLHYAEGESPMSELLRLGGGQGMDVIVEAVSDSGKAARAGVRPGYALVTLNGRSEFAQLPGWQVRLLLDAPPVTLGFDPDPVKPQSSKCTEIRLTRAKDILGIPPRVAVCSPRERSFLAEEVVFKPGSAPLWLSTWGDESVSTICQPAVAGPPRRVYELRRPEAHAIVGHAIRGARALSPDITQREAEEAAWLADAARRARASRWRPLCAVDCVSSCVGDEDVVVEPMPMPLPGSVAPAGWARATSRDAAPGAWRAPPAPSRGPRVDAGGVLAPSRRPTGPQSLFAGDVACDEGATSPATPPEAATPPLPWKGARSSDVFAVEVGSCQI